MKTRLDGCLVFSNLSKTSNLTIIGILFHYFDRKRTASAVPTIEKIIEYNVLGPVLSPLANALSPELLYMQNSACPHTAKAVRGGRYCCFTMATTTRRSQPYQTCVGHAPSKTYTNYGQYSFSRCISKRNERIVTSYSPGSH